LGTKLIAHVFSAFINSPLLAHHVLNLSVAKFAFFIVFSNVLSARTMLQQHYNIIQNILEKIACMETYFIIIENNNIYMENTLEHY